MLVQCWCLCAFLYNARKNNLIYFRSNIKDSRTCRKRQPQWPRPGETSRRLRATLVWPTPRLISKSKVRSLQTVILCHRKVQTKEVTLKLTVVQKRWSSRHYQARTRGCSTIMYSKCGSNNVFWEKRMSETKNPPPFTFTNQQTLEKLSSTFNDFFTSKL